MEFGSPCLASNATFGCAFLFTVSHCALCKISQPATLGAAFTSIIRTPSLVTEVPTLGSATYSVTLAKESRLGRGGDGKDVGCDFWVPPRSEGAGNGDHNT